MEIYYIEDDKAIAWSVKEYLEKEGCRQKGGQDCRVKIFGTIAEAKEDRAAAASGKTGETEKQKETPKGPRAAGRKESVLKALRERQAGTRGREKERPEQRTQTRKKGEAEL